MSDRQTKEFLALGLLGCIAAGLVLFGLVMTGPGASGPTADFDVGHGGDYDFNQCHLSGSFDPGDADHLIIDTNGIESVDDATSVGLTVLPGESIEMYTVSFSATNAPGDVEVLTTGYVTNYCEFEETSE